MAANLGTAFGQVVIGSDTRGLTQAAGGLAAFGKRATIVGGVIGTTFAAAIGSAVKTAATFEQQLADLRSVLRPTAQDMDALREQALELGASTKYSAQEVASAQTELAKGGLEAADILGGALPGALALAAAGDLELAEAATISVNAMKQFGLAGADVTSIADALAVAANQTTADVGDFGAALTQGAAMAKQAGWSFEDTMAALSSLADAGVKGSDAGTSLKTSLQQLINPTAKQAKVAKELGINWLDQNGRMKDAAGISRELVRATRNMTDAERARTFAILAGSDGFRTLSALYASAPAGIRRYIQAQSEAGAAAEVAAIRQDTLAGKYEEFTGAIETLKIRVGSALLPVLADGATAAADFVSALADSDKVGEFADRLADAVEFLGQLGGQLASELGPIARDLLSALGSAAGAAAPVVVALASALATAAGAAVALAGPVVSVSSALLGMPGGAQAAVGAILGLVGAMVGLRAAATAAAGVRWAAAWAPYVSLAARTTMEVGRASGAMAALRYATAGLVSPAGLATVGIGALAGGLGLLMSGAFAGESASQRLANALNAVKSAADGARTAVGDFRDAVSQMKDADLAVATAKAHLTTAQENLNRVMQDGAATEGQRAQAQAAVAQAERQLAVAMRDRAKAQREVGRQAVEGVVELARLHTEVRRGRATVGEYVRVYERLGQSLNVSDDAIAKMAAEQRKLDNQGASTEQRMEALRQAIARQARTIDTSTKSGQRAARILETLGSIDGAGMVRFAGRLQELERIGVPAAQALEIALTEVAQDRTVRIDAEDHASNVARDVARAVEAIHDRTVTLRAIDAASGVARSVAAAVASIPVTKVTTLITRPRHETGSPTVYQTIDMINDLPRVTRKTVAFTPQGSGAMEMALNVIDGFQRILDAREALERRLAAIDAREDAREQRRERARLVRERNAAQNRLKRAKDDERAAATSAARQAEAALREFDRQARLEARRRPLRLRVEQLELAESAFRGLESSLADVSGRLGQALDDALAAALTAVDRGLEGRLATIEQGLRDTLARIDRSPEAQRLRGLSAQIDQARSARDARDVARRRADLTDSVRSAEQELAEAEARTRRMREVLERARTASERAAAQRLLDDAMAAERERRRAVEDARLDLADFEEDQRLAALERERDALEASLNQQRQAAEDAARIQREAAEAEAAAERQRLQTLYAERRAWMERELGDLREQLRAREITQAQFLARIRALYGDPTIAAAAAASGQTIGLEFSRGLDRAQKAVEKSVKQLAKIVKKYLPQSPAEKGPLAYDQRRPGIAVAEGLAQGMAARRAQVEAQADRLAAAAARVGAGATPSAWAAGAAGAAAGAAERPSVTQYVTVNVDDPVEDARAVASRMSYELAMVGGRY